MFCVSIATNIEIKIHPQILSYIHAISIIMLLWNVAVLQLVGV